MSLVPQALSGQLPQARDVDEADRGNRRHGRRALTLDNAFKNAFMGLAFMIVAIALAFSRVGTGWWFWMLIPAFSMMATGLAQYIRIKEREKRAFLPGGIPQPSLQPSDAGIFPARNTGELAAPPSVTEGTTRHLGAEAPTRHFTGDSPK